MSGEQTYKFSDVMSSMLTGRHILHQSQENRVFVGKGIVQCGWMEANTETAVRVRRRGGSLERILFGRCRNRGFGGQARLWCGL